jgi:cytochrome d ubiquinol oxidase subunit II
MIDPVVLLSLILVLSLTAYALLGGADYGGGLWDLLASGPTAARQRATIAHAIGPVWEANHVWLILAVVLVFSAFPRAFAELSTYLHVPLLVVLVGIVFRGSAFVFRAYGPDDPRHERFWGRVFAVASTVTPLFLGICVGAISEGRLPASTAGSFAAVFIAPWLTPFSVAVGIFALVLFGYLAAVYLTLEARDADERRAFRLRALVSGAAVFVLAVAVLLLTTPAMRAVLLASPWAVPLHAATAVCAVAAFASLSTARYELARVAAAAQVAFILWGWGLAQYPYAIRPRLTMHQAAAPANVLVLLLEVLAAGALVLLPALLYLFRIFGPRGTERRPRNRGRAMGDGRE